MSVKTHSIYVDQEFISGNLKGITLENHHYYDIPESDISNTDAYMKILLETRLPISTATGSKYIITRYEIKKGSF